MLPYVIVGLFGSITGFAELLTRYSDAPFKAVKNLPGIAYILTNGLVSLTGYYLITQLNIDFGIEDEPKKLAVIRLLVAGFGAMFFFRSSFMNVKMGERTINVGPQGVLQAILDVLDGQVDRIRAQTRAQEIEPILSGLKYSLIKSSLPTICLALMQNITLERAGKLHSDIEEQHRTSADKETKRINIGLLVYDLVGNGVLKEACNLLRSVQNNENGHIDLEKAGLTPDDVKKVLESN